MVVSSNRAARRAVRLAIWTMAFPASPLFAQGAGGAANNPYLHFTQEHGFTFSTIGGPTNPIIGGPIPGQPLSQDIHRPVDYAYRISTRETTVAQYFEFVHAVAPHAQTLGINGQSMAGLSLVYLGSSGGVPRYQVQPGTENHPAMAQFQYFAMMANWLHHGAPGRDEATVDTFRTGAYDDPRNQAAHNEGALFWIPTRDEWNKAVYWDPNKDGQGNGGYWLYPDGGDEPLIPGRPEDGGETSAGSYSEWPPPKNFPDDDGRPDGVGLYPHVQTPWGLLDVSGGAREWTETFTSMIFQDRRYVEGSLSADGFQEGDSVLFDYIFGFTSQSPVSLSPYVTARFAASVPAPGVPAVAMAAALALSRRRRCVYPANGSS